MDTFRRRAVALAVEAWASTALLLAAATAVGVLVGARGAAPTAAGLAAMGTIALTVAAARWRARSPRFAALLVALWALGAWRGAATRTPLGPAGLPYYVGREVTLAATVASEPEPLDRGENLRVSVQTVTTAGAGHAASGTVLVHLGAITPLAYGDRLSLSGVLQRPPELPGSAPGSYATYLAAQGIETVLDYPRLRRAGSGAGNPLLGAAIALRQVLERGIRRILPGPEAALLLGILLGTRTRALGALTAPFVATGMIHVIAVSGLKVSLVGGAAYTATRRLLGRRRALLPALAVLLFYVLVTGATPAGLRAGLMWTLALTAMRLGRRSDAITSLAVAAALLALFSPRILWDLGFQLSVAGTASIVLLEPSIERRLDHALRFKRRGRVHRLPVIVREGLAVTLAAQFGTAPLLMAGFGQISLVAPLANALLLPLLGPVLGLGAVAALAGALVPPLGVALGWLVYPFLALMILAVEGLARLPLAALPVGAWPLLPVAAYYVLAALGTALLSGHARVMHEQPVPARPLRWRVLAVVAPGTVLLSALVVAQAPRDAYSLAVLPLGGGQGLLAQTPRGDVALLDGGDTPSVLDAALGNHLPFWRARLDTVILSDVDHAHVDGLRDLTTRYTIGRALDSGAIYPAAGYALWRAALRDAGAPEQKLRAGGRYALGDGAYLDTVLPANLDPSQPLTPVAVRLVLGHISALALNRGALAVDPAALQVGGSARPTLLLLPAGAATPDTVAALVRALRPRLVALPSPDDARDDPAADEAALRAARSVGAFAWQSANGAGLEITATAASYRVRVIH